MNRRAAAIRSLSMCTLLVVMLSTGGLLADKPVEKPVTPPSDSWAGQLEGLASWIDKHRGGSACTERCFTLSRLKLTGSGVSGVLKFEIEGNLLTDGSHAVPLFGAPAHVRIEQATEGGKPAAIGFEGDHYYLSTTTRHFVVKGVIALDEDRALSIPGPLNAFEADLTDGRCVEGSRLSGLSAFTVHFDRTLTKQPAVEPTVFQLSRAVRVARETTFEYRLVMRSGTDLGVVRLPLAFGERVLDATGVTGFRIDGRDVVLPTSGRSADIKITGTLPQAGSFKNDDRSPYEWWLLESDAEHRITVTGDAKQLDSTESPIARTLPTSRLYMVQRGQHIDVAVQTLSSVNVLAAVVRSHERTVVVTPRYEVVSDETLTYENNGIDYLLLTPGGKPIYLATDGKAERIMSRDKDSDDVMVPLRTGSHSIRLQTQSQAGVAGLFGHTEVPLSTYPLTSSRVDVRLGLPRFVFPIALLGGDHPYWFADEGDVFALVGAAVAALLVLRGRSRRLLGTVALGGLWFVSAPLFVATMGCVAVAGFVWLLRRLLSGKKLVFAIVALVAVGGFFLLVTVAAVGLKRESAAERTYDIPAPAPTSVGGRAAGEGDADSSAAPKARADAKTGNFLAQNAAGGVLEGVTPVALALPSFDRSVSASRELVTRERPFRPVLVYATAWAIAPLGLLWLASIGALFRIYAPTLRGSWRSLRARLAVGAAASPSQTPAPANEAAGAPPEGGA